MVFTEDDIYNLAVVAGVKEITSFLVKSISEQLHTLTFDILKKISYIIEHEYNKSTVTLSIVRNAVPSTYDNYLNLTPMYNAYSLSEAILNHARENCTKFRFTHRNRFIKGIFDIKSILWLEQGGDFSLFTDEAVDFLQKYLEDHVIELLRRATIISSVIDESVILQPRYEHINVPLLKIDFLATIEQSLTIFDIDRKTVTSDKFDKLNTLLNYIVSVLNLELVKMNMIYDRTDSSNLILAAKMIGLEQFVKNNVKLRFAVLENLRINVLQKLPISSLGDDLRITTFMILYDICGCFLNNDERSHLHYFYHFIGVISDLERKLEVRIERSGDVSGPKLRFLHSNVTDDLPYSDVEKYINTDDLYSEMKEYHPYCLCDDKKSTQIDPDIKYRDTPYISDVNKDLIGRINAVLCNKPQARSIPQLTHTIDHIVDSPTDYSIPQLTHTIDHIVDSPTDYSIPQLTHTIDHIVDSPTDYSIPQLTHTIDHIVDSPTDYSIPQPELFSLGVFNHTPSSSPISNLSHQVSNLSLSYTPTESPIRLSSSKTYTTMPADIMKAASLHLLNNPIQSTQQIQSSQQTQSVQSTYPMGANFVKAFDSKAHSPNDIETGKGKHTFSPQTLPREIAGPYPQNSKPVVAPNVSLASINQSAGISNFGIPNIQLNPVTQNIPLGIPGQNLHLGQQFKPNISSSSIPGIPNMSNPGMQLGAPENPPNTQTQQFSGIQPIGPSTTAPVIPGFGFLQFPPNTQTQQFSRIQPIGPSTTAPVIPGFGFLQFQPNTQTQQFYPPVGFQIPVMGTNPPGKPPTFPNFPNFQQPGFTRK